MIPAQLALSWVLAQKSYLVPIPGTRRFDRLEESLKTADVLLINEEVKKNNSEIEKIEIFGERYPAELAARVGK